MGKDLIYFSSKHDSNKNYSIQVNGEIYDGEWKDGKKHGSGLWKGVKGNHIF